MGHARRARAAHLATQESHGAAVHPRVIGRACHSRLRGAFSLGASTSVRAAGEHARTR